MGKSNELDIVKRPHTKSSYSEDSLTDLVRCWEDPFFFIERFVKVQHPLRGALPLELYPFQKDLVKAFHEQRNTIALTARQMGKSVTYDTSVKAEENQQPIGSLLNLTSREKFINLLERWLIKLSV